MLEKIFSISLFLLSILGYFIANTFENGFMIDSGLGANFFPQLITIILGILSIILFLQGVRKKNKEKNNINNCKHTLFIIGLCILYIFILNKLGYIISTILFCMSIIKILNGKNSLINILFSIIFPLTIYYLFSKIFNISLPMGDLYV